MDDQTIATMNEAEFDALVERFIERGEDQVTPRTCLQVMTEVAEQRSQHEVELSGRIVNGEIIFDLPALLPVGANTLYVGDTKIILTAGGKCPGVSSRSERPWARSLRDQTIPRFTAEIIAEAIRAGSAKTTSSTGTSEANPRQQRNFYERFRRGEKVKAGWVNDSDFEQEPVK